MKWPDTVRPWKGSAITGVELVTTISPDMIGLRFRDDWPACAEEREELVNAGLRFKRELRAYVTNLPPAGHLEGRRLLWDRLEALYWRIQKRRATQRSGDWSQNLDQTGTAHEGHLSWHERPGLPESRCGGS